MPLPSVPFFDRVDKNGPNGCWVWTGPKNQLGYGNYSLNHKNLKAHRWSYEYHKGPIPEGLQIDHLCRNRACVNPDHLEAVTKKENSRRSNAFVGINARKTHCPHGHPYDEENTYRDKNGYRKCRACQRAANSQSDSREKQRARWKRNYDPEKERARRQRRKTGL